MEKTLHKCRGCGGSLARITSFTLASGLWVEVGTMEKPFVKRQTVCTCTQDSKGDIPVNMSQQGRCLKYRSLQITQRRANHVTNAGRPSATFCSDLAVPPRVQESHGSVRNVGKALPQLFPHTTQSPAGDKPFENSSKTSLLPGMIIFVHLMGGGDKSDMGNASREPSFDR